MEAPTNIAGYDPHRDAAGYHWDGEAARRAVDFFPQVLTLTSGAASGKPFDLQPWQRDYLATLFGWKRADGTRRYRESLFFTPRKNGKTETGAGIALYTLCCDGEGKPEIYSAAKTRDQASRVFEPASIMLRKSSLLAPRLSAIESQKRIVYREKYGYYAAISADAATAHGKNPSCVLFDELHTQPNRSLYDGLKSGMGARKQPLFVSMTTAGFDRHSICHEVWKYAQHVRDGVLKDPHFLPMLYQIEDGEDWSDEDVWKRVNPNVGVTISMEFLREEFRRAEASPQYENTFRNLYLNQWTEQAVRWLSMEAWDACAAEPPDYRHRRVWIGLDMSSTCDLTAAVIAFPVDGGGFAIVPRFWMPMETARHRERQDRVPFRQWSEEGLITLTPGSAVDYEMVRDELIRISHECSVMKLAADPWNCDQMLQQLDANGIKVEKHRPGMASMTGPSKAFESLVARRTLMHGGNPVLRWMAANVSVKTDGNENITPVKDKSTGRIDGIVASIIACWHASMASMAPSGQDLLVTI